MVKQYNKFKYILLAVVALAVMLTAVITLCGGGAYADEGEKIATVVISAGGKEFTYRDEHIVPTDFTVDEEIRNRRINADIPNKFELVDKYLAKGADYKTALEVCFPLLKNTVNAVAEYVYTPALDAAVVYKNKRFGVTPEKSGIAIDENRLYASIYYTLKFGGGGEVIVPTKVLLPAVTAAELNAELCVRGSYTTEYSSSTAARAHNVELALSKIDGASIEPGQSLSFNQTVGARTESNGFKSAKIIVDGKYTDGVGGGVCQASTAVYNAALLAGLTAAANAHSICPSYCPPGLDAMISGYSDLVLTNTTDRTVRISVITSGRAATVKIYGIKNECRIVPESVVVKCIKHENVETVDTKLQYFDSTAVSGDRRLVSSGKDGYVSETYLNYYNKSGLIRRVKIRTNEYKSIPQVIAVAP